ncbi:hypothetical protein R6Q59_031917 [Mikania micrantha]
MGLHLVLGLCTLNGGSLLALPFVLKVLLSRLRPFKDVIMSMAQDSRLLVFQLNQIIGFEANNEGGLGLGFDANWRRWVRFIHQRLLNVGHSMLFSNYDQSLQTLSIVAF